MLVQNMTSLMVAVEKKMVAMEQTCRRIDLTSDLIFLGLR